MRRIAASAVLVGLALAGPAHAQSDAQVVARALESDPVYVDPSVRQRFTVGEQGRVRLAIVRAAIGRIKVAVVPASAAHRTGGLRSFANRVDYDLHVRGALIVVAGNDYWVVTSYPDSEAGAAALRTAVTRRPNDRLVTELTAAIPALARVDPGPEGEVGQQEPGAAPAGDADDFLDDIIDTFRLGVLIIAIAVALPFILLVVILIARVRRSRAHEQEVRESGERSADDELVALGDEIRELDQDTSMPNANRAALAEYEQAIASYDQANELLSGEPSAYRVEQAHAAIAAGRRHLAATRERLG